MGDTIRYEEIPPQDCYFFEGKWTEQCVNTFINLLISEKHKGYWKANNKNTTALKSAQKFVNIMMEKDFNWDDVLAQRDMLLKRYMTFKSLMETNGVNWDRRFNHVYAYSSSWIQLAKVFTDVTLFCADTKGDEFVKAFYHKGDIMYDKIRSLFDPDEDLSIDVINISSGSPNIAAPNSIFNPISIDISDKEQEVESPLIGDRKIPRKRLFHDQEPSNAIALVSFESTNGNGSSVNPCPHFAEFIGRNAIVVKKEASSCASNSPSKWTFSPLGK